MEETVVYRIYYRMANDNNNILYKTAWFHEEDIAVNYDAMIKAQKYCSVQVVRETTKYEMVIPVLLQ